MVDPKFTLLNFLNVGAQWDTFRPSPGSLIRVLSVAYQGLIGGSSGGHEHGLIMVLSGAYQGLIRG